MVEILEVKEEKDMVDKEEVFDFVRQFCAKIQIRNYSKFGQILPEVRMPEVEVETKVKVVVEELWRWVGFGGYINNGGGHRSGGYGGGGWHGGGDGDDRGDNGGGAEGGGGSGRVVVGEDGGDDGVVIEISDIYFRI